LQQIVRRTRRSTTGPSPPHLVTKDDLEKAIRFLRDLVRARDKAFLDR
jgi:hypothetical protein